MEGKFNWKYKLLHRSASIHFEENIPNTILWYFLGVAYGLPGLPWWLSSKESPANAGNADLIPGLGRYHGEGNGDLLQYSCWENPMDGLWGGKELDTTELLSTHKEQNLVSWVKQSGLNVRVVINNAQITFSSFLNPESNHFTMENTSFSNWT